MSPYQPFGSGGDERVRTDDPLLAKQVLSQLSYTPINGSKLCGVLSTPTEPQKLNNDSRKVLRFTYLRTLTLKYEAFFMLHCSIERR